MSVNGNMNFYVFNESIDNAARAMEELYEYSKNPIVEEKSEDTKEEDKGFNWLALVVVVLILILVASFPVSLLLNSKNKK